MTRPVSEPRRDAIQVWVVGPASVVHAGLCALLADLPGIQLAGRAPDLSALLAAWPARPPDLVLLACPRSAELALLPTLRHRHPDRSVLCVDLSGGLAAALAALQAGARGYLTPLVTGDELAAAVRQAARGELVLPPDLAQDLIRDLAAGRSPVAHHDESLTLREHEILDLVCQGLGNKAIAQRLFLSLRTVENHLANIYGKLGVNSRTEAAVLAIQQGWTVAGAA